MELKQYLSAVRRRWPYLAASIGVICGIVLYHVLTTEPAPIFRAVSRVFVSANVSTVTADDVAQMAVSNHVAEQTLTQLKLDQTGWSAQNVMQSIRADVGSQSTNKSNVVTITAYGRTPELAIDLTNTVAEFAKERAIGLTQLGTFRAGEQVAAQLAQARRRLDAAAESLREFKSAHSDLIVPLDFTEAQRVVASLTEEADSAASAISENQDRVVALKRSLGQRSARRLNASSAASGAAVDRLQAELAAKEVELMNARLKYTNDHPTVKRTQTMIDNLTARINTELQKSYKLENAPSSLEYQFITGDITRYEAERMAAAAKRNAIQAAVSRARSQLSRVPDLEVQYAKLNTEYRTAQSNYLSLREKYDQAQLSVRIAQQQLQTKEGIGFVDRATSSDETPGSKFKKPQVKLAIGFLIALIIGLGIILFLEGVDTSIRDVDQMEDRYQLPVLGVIPTLKEASLREGATLVLRDSPSSPFAEPYRIMRGNFVALASQHGAKSVIITSTLPSEGKTTTAANFAATLAEGHSKVVVVDADMRNPSLHRLFSTRKDPGLSDYLAGHATLEQVIYDTNVNDLKIVSAGNIPENPSYLLTGPRMRELLDYLESEYDYVVIDTPPAVAFSDAMELGSIADSMIVVVGAGSKLESAHFRARSHLANVSALLVGTVLNRVAPTDVDSYRYSQKYYPKLPAPGWQKPEQVALPDGSTK